MAQLQAQVHDATQTYQERVSRLPPESRASVEKRLHGKVDHTLEEVDAAEVTVEEMKERLARQDAEMQELRAKYDTLVASRDGTGTVSPTNAAVAEVVAEALSSAIADSAEPEPAPGAVSNILTLIKRHAVLTYRDPVLYLGRAAAFHKVML